MQHPALTLHREWKNLGMDSENESVCLFCGCRTERHWVYQTRSTLPVKADRWCSEAPEKKLAGIFPQQRNKWWNWAERSEVGERDVASVSFLNVYNYYNCITAILIYFFLGFLCNEANLPTAGGQSTLCCHLVVGHMWVVSGPKVSSEPAVWSRIQCSRWFVGDEDCPCACWCRE